MRPEGKARIDAIVDANAARYEAVTRAVLGEPAPAASTAPGPGGLRRERPVAAPARLGQNLNAARLVKAAFTFQGGLDYAAWKIRRHAGVAVVVTEQDRRKPFARGPAAVFSNLASGRN